MDRIGVRRRWLKLWPLPLVLFGALGLVLPLTGWADCESDRGLDVRVVDEDEHDGYRTLIEKVKRDEQQARDELARLEREGGSDEAVASGLKRIAGEYRLAGESTRQAYLKLVERMKDPSIRSRALRILLAEAPTTEETGRKVIQLAVAGGDGRRLARVLEYMNEIRESDLVRGPLAGDYLDAVEKLADDEERADALANLLHPEAISKPATLRALSMAGRLADDEGRMKVLREVTDHAELDADVEAAYRRVADGIKSASDQRVAMERLDGAKDEVREPRRGRRHADAREIDEKVRLKMRKLELRMRRMQEKLERNLGDLDDLDVGAD